jgi:hypothetical protein
MWQQNPDEVSTLLGAARVDAGRPATLSSQADRPAAARNDRQALHHRRHAALDNSGRENALSSCSLACSHEGVGCPPESERSVGVLIIRRLAGLITRESRSIGYRYVPQAIHALTSETDPT